MTDIIIELRSCKAELETELLSCSWFFFLVLVERPVSRNGVKSTRRHKNEMSCVTYKVYEENRIVMLRLLDP